MAATAPMHTSRTRVAADRWFRGVGLVAVALLATTVAMLALRLDAWRAPFVFAHLAALLALVPLGLVIVWQTYARGYEERRSILGALQATLTHDRVTTLLVLLVLVAVATSLSQFNGGIRELRAGANFTAVGTIVVLVVRYLRA